jgi:zinc/manganese transport system substrate-binding protein
MITILIISRWRGARLTQLDTSRRAIPVLFVTVALLAASCDLAAESGDDGRPLVVATTTILGDVVANVVGDAARVEVLMPIGADPHDFQASASQIVDLNRAELVVANGLGLEKGLEDVLDAAAGDGVRVFEVAPLLDPLPFELTNQYETEPEEEGADPHVWLDPLRMADAARLIAAELGKIDSGIDWMARSEEYAGELEQTDRKIVEGLSTVPEGKRRLVSNHQSLGYFASRYQFEVLGVVIPGGSTLADPSSARLAELVNVMRREGVTVIFGETTEPGALATAVADELGEEVAVVSLHTESLGEPGSGAETLIGLLRTNAALITEALAAER